MVRYIIETNGVTIKVDLYCGPGSILGDRFDPSNFPLVLVKCIYVVIRFEFLVEVVGFELGNRFLKH